MMQQFAVEASFPAKKPLMQSPSILVIDDSPTILKVLTKQLRERGATVTKAINGLQGYEIARSGNFDLIITDVEMPGLNGLQLCERLKRDSSTQSIPVVIVSDFADQKHIEYGFKAGAATYISKVQACKRLWETIEEVLNKTPPPRERTILIVDDSNHMLEMIGNELRQAGFGVCVAENGSKALSVIGQTRPDLIISNLNLPGMNGFTLFRTIRTDENLTEVPFIVMSVAGDTGNMRRMVHQGVAAFLVKPFGVNQLITTVEKLLSDRYQSLANEMRRLDRERGLMLGSIGSLVLALEARDPYTRGHSMAVSRMMVAMAKKMGFSLEEIDTIRTIGVLHDLGKIGIRDDILLKPGPLTRAEFEIVKRHPVIAVEILSPMPSLVGMIPGIASHHERVNGEGYPQGLKGNRIPLSARMVAVADTYHALISDRPYRRGLPADKCLQILEDLKGKQLCPNCTEAFMHCLGADLGEISCTF